MALIRLHMTMSLDGAAAYGWWATGRLAPLLGLLVMGLRDGGAECHGGADPAARVSPPPVRAYRDGVLVNVLNPKVGLFLFAFLPQFLDPGAAARPPAARSRWRLLRPRTHPGRGVRAGEAAPSAPGCGVYLGLGADAALAG